jgi:hypothetical protein
MPNLPGAAVLRYLRKPTGTFVSSRAKRLVEFRRAGFAAVMPGPGTRLRVEVKAPATTHELSVGKLTAWLEGSGKSPAEQALKTRLRAIVF